MTFLWEVNCTLYYEHVAYKQCICTHLLLPQNNPKHLMITQLKMFKLQRKNDKLI